MAGEEHVVEENTLFKSENKKKHNTVIDNFRKLTHNKESIRLKSSVALLKHLSENKNTENGEQELKYALGRLIRGLGASTNNSKIGFYTVLVALFNCINDTNVSEILEHVKAQLHSSGSNSKSENADISAGQILLYGALIRTNLYEKASVDEKKYIVEQLLVSGKKRQYLYLSSVTFIIELCEKTKEADFKAIIWPLITSEIGKPWSEQNIDSLYLFCALRNKFCNIVNKKFLLEIYSKTNFKQLANILLDIPRITVANHPFYELICKKISSENLGIDFINVIDENLTKYNHNRHFVVTKMIIFCMNNMPNKNIAHLLCKNYIQHTLQYFKSVKGSKNPEMLQERIYNLFNTIIEILKQDNIKSDTKIGVLKKLLFYPGIFIFEKITRSKIVQHIISTLDFDGVKQLSKLYRDVISGDNSYFAKDDEKQHCLNNDRVYASQLLVKLLMHPASNDQMDWKIEQLKFLMKLSLFKLDESKNVGVELAASLKETFYRALALKLSKLTDLQNLLSSLVFEIRDHLDAQNLLRNPLTDEAVEIWKQSLQQIQKLETKHKKVYKVFHTLLLHMSLQLFSDVKLAIDSLKELFSCYERVRSQKKQPDEIVSEDPMWIEVVVDLFLNLLSHKSYLLRNLINCVFPHLCRYLNMTALHQILDTLDPKNEGNPLISNSNESESEDEDVRSENQSESDESDTSNDENEEIDDNVNDKLKMAVQIALGGSVSDEESLDLDEMGDDEGERLDEALATAFKQFKPNVSKKSNKQKKEDEALTHFRVRALDLIDLYLDSEPSMYMCLEIMIVLLRSLEFAIKDEHQRPLLNRIRSSLKKLSELKKFSSIEDIEESTLPDLFDSLLDKGTKNYFVLQEMNDKISECCSFIVRCTEYMNSLDEVTSKCKKHIRKAIIGTISNSLGMYFTKRESYVPYGLFKNVLQSSWNGNFKLIPSIAQYSFSDSVRVFRRSQALELAKIFFGNHRLLNANSDPTKFDEFLEQFSENTLNVLPSNAQNSNLKEKYVRDLFNTLAVLKRSPVNHEKINWVEIGCRLREFRANFAFTKQTRVSYNKLCRILCIDANVKLNPNQVKLGTVDVEQSDGEGEVIAEGKIKNKAKIACAESNKRQIRKKKHKTTNLKKETQTLRMQSLSEGLSIDFSEASLKNERLDGENDKKRMKPDESAEIENYNGEKKKKKLKTS